MAKDKVTIQDIADALGISRNTASKALNGSDTIPDETRSKVIKKAIELKYKQFAYMETDNLLNKGSGNIALLTANMPNNSHFGGPLINGLEKRISDEGYTLSIHIVRDIDQNSLALPKNLDITNVDGIICIELFDLEYSRLITDLGIPTIFIDCAAEISFPEFNADILLMENEHSTYQMVKKLTESGHKSIGFVGDYHHCKSFYERWTGYQRALIDSNLQLDTATCIIDDDRLFFSEPGWLDKRIGQMEPLPSAFVCANDFIAVGVMKSLKNHNILIPDEIKVCGFDNAPESRIVEPHLTTVHIYSNEMGIKAAETLLSRIKSPQQPFHVSHVYTKPVYRESTSGSL
ncbi:LacI family DNA-binding transcriptional regulator [Neobacillus mesonae]|nr:LacI family DNA-binding transcriptional regulator [Neobacillus mesonae]